jgi:hypothetical protein
VKLQLYQLSSKVAEQIVGGGDHASLVAAEM